MRRRMRAVLLGLSLGLLVTGCGGSSSETPPPLEPDPTLARYTGPRLSKHVDAEPASAKEAEPALEDEQPARPSRPAAGTWGK